MKKYLWISLCFLLVLTIGAFYYTNNKTVFAAIDSTSCSADNIGVECNVTGQMIGMPELYNKPGVCFKEYNGPSDCCVNSYTNFLGGQVRTTLVGSPGYQKCCIVPGDVGHGPAPGVTPGTPFSKWVNLSGTPVEQGGCCDETQGYTLSSTATPGYNICCDPGKHVYTYDQIKVGGGGKVVAAGCCLPTQKVVGQPGNQACCPDNVTTVAVQTVNGRLLASCCAAGQESVGDIGYQVCCGVGHGYTQVDSNGKKQGKCCDKIPHYSFGAGNGDPGYQECCGLNNQVLYGFKKTVGGSEVDASICCDRIDGVNECDYNGNAKCCYGKNKCYTKSDGPDCCDTNTKQVCGNNKGHQVCCDNKLACAGKDTNDAKCCGAEGDTVYKDAGGEKCCETNSTAGKKICGNNAGHQVCCEKGQICSGGETNNPSCCADNQTAYVERGVGKCCDGVVKGMAPNQVCCGDATNRDQFENLEASSSTQCLCKITVPPPSKEPVCEDGKLMVNDDRPTYENKKCVQKKHEISACPGGQATQYRCYGIKMQMLKAESGCDVASCKTAIKTDYKDAQCKDIYACKTVDVTNQPCCPSTCSPSLKNFFNPLIDKASAFVAGGSGDCGSGDSGSGDSGNTCTKKKAVLDPDCELVDVGTVKFDACGKLNPPVGGGAAGKVCYCKAKCKKPTWQDTGDCNTKRYYTPPPIQYRCGTGQYCSKDGMGACSTQATGVQVSVQNNFCRLPGGNTQPAKCEATPPKWVTVEKCGCVSTTKCMGNNVVLVSQCTVCQEQPGNSGRPQCVQEQPPRQPKIIQECGGNQTASFCSGQDIMTFNMTNSVCIEPIPGMAMCGPPQYSLAPSGTCRPQCCSGASGGVLGSISPIFNTLKCLPCAFASICNPGDTKPCACGGTSTCQADGTWSSCPGTHAGCQNGKCACVQGAGSDDCSDCRDPNTCTVGTTTPCTGGGKKECKTDGTWGPCLGGPNPILPCTNGNTKSCACGGTTTCVNGKWNECGPKHADCANGKCVCADGAGEDKCNQIGKDCCCGEGSNECCNSGDTFPCACGGNMSCNGKGLWVPCASFGSCTGGKCSCVATPPYTPSGSGADQCSTPGGSCTIKPLPGCDTTGCIPGSERPCESGSGTTDCPGIQTCSGNGTWNSTCSSAHAECKGGSCECVSGQGADSCDGLGDECCKPGTDCCQEGSSKPCPTTTGGSASCTDDMVCDSNGNWGSCGPRHLECTVYGRCDCVDGEGTDETCVKDGECCAPGTDCCSPGETQDCYGGSSANCTSQQVCDANGNWGSCEPRHSECKDGLCTCIDNEDSSTVLDSCDGENTYCCIDGTDCCTEGSTEPCDTTLGTTACPEGVRECDANGNWGSCIPQHLECTSTGTCECVNGQGTDEDCTEGQTCYNPGCNEGDERQCFAGVYPCYGKQVCDEYGQWGTCSEAHLACDPLTASCECEPGPGANECDTLGSYCCPPNTDCCKPGDEKVCSGGGTADCPGLMTCDTDGNWGKCLPAYADCENNQCQCVPGQGVDKCSNLGGVCCPDGVDCCEWGQYEECPCGGWRYCGYDKVWGECPDNHTKCETSTGTCVCETGAGLDECDILGEKCCYDGSDDCCTQGDIKLCEAGEEGGGTAQCPGLKVCDSLGNWSKCLPAFADCIYGKCECVPDFFYYATDNCQLGESCADKAPTATNLSVSNITPCTGIPGTSIVNFSWYYNAPDNAKTDPQASFRIQITESDDPSFSSPLVSDLVEDLNFNPNDDGKVLNTRPISLRAEGDRCCSHNTGTCPTGCSSDQCTTTCGYIQYNTNYIFRVKVKDAKTEMWSDWTYYNGWTETTNASSASSFEKAGHPGPYPLYTVDNNNPEPNQQVVFMDASVCYRNDGTSYACSTVNPYGGNNGYKWVFGDGTSETTKGGTSHTYIAAKRDYYKTSLTVCDETYTCCTSNLNIQVSTPGAKELPSYKEISPF